MSQSQSQNDGPGCGCFFLLGVLWLMALGVGHLFFCN